MEEVFHWYEVWFLFLLYQVYLPELKCERFDVPFSVSLSRGLLRESPISGLGQVSIPASGSAAISIINPQFIKRPLHARNAQALRIFDFFVLLFYYFFPCMLLFFRFSFYIYFFFTSILRFYFDICICSLFKNFCETIAEFPYLSFLFFWWKYRSGFF